MPCCLFLNSAYLTQRAVLLAMPGVSRQAHLEHQHQASHLASLCVKGSAALTSCPVSPHQRPLAFLSSNLMSVRCTEMCSPQSLPCNGSTTSERSISYKCKHALALSRARQCACDISYAHAMCRYYQEPGVNANGLLPDGDESFADLKPGQITQETREALGLRPLDPPPWLDKMRQLGYPPTYK